MPFPSGKTIKDLGIDTTRKFVVVDDSHFYFRKGDILIFSDDTHKSESPGFKRVRDGLKDYCDLSSLDYADETKYGTSEKSSVVEKKPSKWVTTKSEEITLEEDGRKAVIHVKDGKFERCKCSMPAGEYTLSDWQFLHRVTSKIVSLFPNER